MKLQRKLGGEKSTFSLIFFTECVWSARHLRFRTFRIVTMILSFLFGLWPKTSICCWLAKLRSLPCQCRIICHYVSGEQLQKTGQVIHLRGTSLAPKVLLSLRCLELPIQQWEFCLWRKETSGHKCLVFAKVLFVWTFRRLSEPVFWIYGTTRAIRYRNCKERNGELWHWKITSNWRWISTMTIFVQVVFMQEQLQGLFTSVLLRNCFLGQRLRFSLLLSKELMERKEHGHPRQKIA